MNRFFFLILFLVGCNSDFTAKKEGYFKIDFPPHRYQTFDEPQYPYRFEYPVYSKVVKDSAFFTEQTENPYWINVEFPDFNGKIFISYKEIGGTSLYKVKRADDTYRDSIGRNDFDKMVKDAYNLAYKNDIKAYSIEDSLIKTPAGLSGIYFKLGGNVATANQFFLTDSVKHFVRGALYFDVTPNEDSLRPVNSFLKQDVLHLINTLRWK